MRKIPAGTRDKLFKRAQGSYELEGKFNAVTASRGFTRVETPTIEYAQNFDNEDELFRFFDKKGETLALRSDLTTPVARMVASTKLELPLKLSYSGKVFRSSDPMMGVDIEMHQAGIELIGYESIKAELELLLTLSEFLDAEGIEDYHFEIGHAGVYKAFAAESADEAEFRAALLAKNTSVLPLIARLYGEPESVFAQVEETPEIKEIKVLLALAKKALPRVKFTVDLGLVPNHSYYTGILINAYAPNIADAFASGGRYDNEFPAVGLGVNLDAFEKLAAPHTNKTLIHFAADRIDDALKILAETPDAQLSIFDNIIETKEFANRWGFDEIIEIGGN
ncbi:MAG: ATP phosphoribosyltransferase regulatory subunit [Lactobacillales bacterium]|jgi:ATP phosphoribosyltransferase regulatory subunit|nr:ATP phosphoribosyltransferase regulatory subunit [Lactobacillales bacterium]